MKLFKGTKVLDEIVSNPVFITVGVAAILWIGIFLGLYWRESPPYRGVRSSSAAYSYQRYPSPFFRKPFGSLAQEIVYQHPYDIFVYKICEDYEVDPELVRAIIWTESNYRADATNGAGTCFGLMQINKNAHKNRMTRLGVSDLSDPRGNILVGVDLLSQLFSERDDLNWVLSAYNAGYAVANRNYRLRAVGPYSRLVQERYQFLKNGGEIDGIS